MRFALYTYKKTNKNSRRKAGVKGKWRGICSMFPVGLIVTMGQ